MGKFADRVVLITGAGSGIGRSLARKLSANKAVLGLVDINPAGMEELDRELGDGRRQRMVADVTQPAQMRMVAKEVEGTLGPIDVLIANAGIGVETSAKDLRAEDMESIIRVNLLGVINTIEAFLPGMLERNHGHLVAISSLASYRGFPKMAGYCAAKAGVNALMDSLRTELRDTKIACTTICPGWIQTPMTAGITLPPNSLMQVEKAADLILSAIQRRKSFFSFPGHQARNVGTLRWLPNGISDWLIFKMYSKLEKK